MQFVMTTLETRNRGKASFVDPKTYVHARSWIYEYEAVIPRERTPRAYQHGLGNPRLLHSMKCAYVSENLGSVASIPRE